MLILTNMDAAAPNIFHYTDYRKFLADWYAAAKSGGAELSYRIIAQKVGFKSPGHLTMIIKGEANISKPLARRFAQFLKFKKRETDYFVTMVACNQAKTHSEKRRLFERLATFKQSVIHRVDSSHYAFYDKWHHSAIRVLLDFYPFTGDYKSLGKMLVPAISPAEARKSVELQEKLQFLKKDENGFLRPTELFLTTGYDAQSVSLNNFVLRSMDLARDALDRFPKEERNLSSLTIGVSKQGFETIQNEIREFRKKIFDLVKSEKAETVYQLSMQLFPLSKRHTAIGDSL